MSHDPEHPPYPCGGNEVIGVVDDDAVAVPNAQFADPGRELHRVGHHVGQVAFLGTNVVNIKIDGARYVASLICGATGISRRDP